MVMMAWTPETQFFIAASGALDIFGYKAAAADVFITKSTLDIHTNFTIPVLPFMPLRFNAGLTRRPFAK